MDSFIKIYLLLAFACLLLFLLFPPLTFSPALVSPSYTPEPINLFDFLLLLIFNVNNVIVFGIIGTVTFIIVLAINYRR
jgi:hypothetical protein